MSKNNSLASLKMNFLSRFKHLKMTSQIFDLLSRHQGQFVVLVTSSNPEPTRKNMGIFAILETNLTLKEATKLAEETVQKITSPLMEVKIRPMGRFFEFDDSTPDNTLKVFDRHDLTEMDRVQKINELESRKKKERIQKIIDERMTAESIHGSPEQISLLAYCLYLASEQTKNLEMAEKKQEELVTQLKQIFAETPDKIDCWQSSLRDYLIETDNESFYEKIVHTFEALI